MGHGQNRKITEPKELILEAEIDANEKKRIIVKCFSLVGSKGQTDQTNQKKLSNGLALHIQKEILSQKRMICNCVVQRFQRYPKS